MKFFPRIVDNLFNTNVTFFFSSLLNNHVIIEAIVSLWIFSLVVQLVLDASPMSIYIFMFSDR
jgi:hypothetical protein